MFIKGEILLLKLSL